MVVTDINGNVTSTQTTSVDSSTGETTIITTFEDGYTESITTSPTGDVVSTTSTYPASVEDGSVTVVTTDYVNETITTVTTYMDDSVLSTVTDLEGVLLLTTTITAPDETGIVTQTDTYADGSVVETTIDTDTSRSFDFSDILGDNVRVQNKTLSAPDPISSNTMETVSFSDQSKTYTTRNKDNIVITTTEETPFVNNTNTKTTKDASGNVIEVESGALDNSGNFTSVIKDANDTPIKNRTIITVNEVTTETLKTIDDQTLSTKETKIMNEDTVIHDQREDGNDVVQTYLPMSLRVRTNVTEPVVENKQVTTEEEFTGSFFVQTLDVAANIEVQKNTVVKDRKTGAFVERIDRVVQEDGTIVESEKNEQNELLFEKTLTTQENGQIAIVKKNSSGTVVSNGTTVVQTDGSKLTTETDASDPSWSSLLSK